MLHLISSQRRSDHVAGRLGSVRIESIYTFFDAKRRESLLRDFSCLREQVKVKWSYSHDSPTCKSGSSHIKCTTDAVTKYICVTHKHKKDLPSLVCNVEPSPHYLVSTAVFDSFEFLFHGSLAPHFAAFIFCYRQFLRREFQFRITSSVCQSQVRRLHRSNQLYSEVIWRLGVHYGRMPHS